MAFCCEIKKGLCNITIRSTVNFAFCHFILGGVFVTIFVFTNVCYPPFYYVDYMYGISGAVLIVTALAGLILASFKYCQILRSLWAVIIILNILLLSVGSVMYTYQRWNDVISTAFVRSLRKPIKRDFPDVLWYCLTVIGCLQCPFFCFYLIFVTSYMCNKWRSYLFTEPERNFPIFTRIDVPTVAQSDAYNTQSQKSQTQ